MASDKPRHSVTLKHQSTTSMILARAPKSFRKVGRMFPGLGGVDAEDSLPLRSPLAHLTAQPTKLTIEREAGSNGDVKFALAAGLMFVSWVRFDGPAWQAGLRFGDEVLAIGDTSVRDIPVETCERLVQAGLGSTYTLEVRPQAGICTYELTGYEEGDMQFKSGGGILKVKKSSRAAQAGVGEGETLVSVNGFNTLGMPTKVIQNMLLMGSLSESGARECNLPVQICTMSTGLFEQVTKDLDPELVEGRRVPLMFK